MGVRDLVSKLSGSSSRSEAQHRLPPPVPHHTRPNPGSSSSSSAVGQDSAASSGTAAANNSTPASPAAGLGQFAVIHNGALELADGTPFRFASLNAPELLDGDEFEVEDTFRTLAGFGRRVTRCYTLKVSGTSPHLGDGGHVRGWDAQGQDWIYHEPEFVKMDKMLALAAKYDVKVIIPIINQDFGSHHNNWVGNWVDLIRHRKNSGWSYQDAKANVDFFIDRECIDAFKQIVAFLLNRINTITGTRYGDDPSVLFWETGNELQHSIKGKKPPPGAWTAEIAQHIKSLAPRSLVLDGSFAKCDSVSDAYASEALKSPLVDAISYHYYGNGDTKRVKKDVALARKYKKIFIAGEYGFLDHSNDYAIFLADAEREGCAGSLVWSLRPHSSKGGFKTHREDEVNSAYHAPGWPSPRTPAAFRLPREWDSKEHAVIQYIWHASFSINGEQTPATPPRAVYPPNIGMNGPNLVWQGAAWANTYEIWVGPGVDARDSEWQCVAREVIDATAAGETSFHLGSVIHPGMAVKMRGVSLDGMPGTWSNTIVL